MLGRFGPPVPGAPWGRRVERGGRGTFVFPGNRGGAPTAASTLPFFPRVPPDSDPRRLARFTEKVADVFNSLVAQGQLVQTGPKSWTLVAPDADTDADTDVDAGSSGGGGALSGTFAARPAAASVTPGTLYLATDGPFVSFSSGAAWSSWSCGAPVTEPPSVGSLTWVNQGGATATNAGGGIALAAPMVSSTLYRGLVASAPATPYTFTAAFVPTLVGGPADTYPGAGIMMRESSTGLCRCFTLLWRASTPGGLGNAVNAACNLEIMAWHGDTTVGDIWTVGAALNGPLCWLRVKDDGTNLAYSASGDGRQWAQVYSESRTEYMLTGPNQLGVAVFPYSNQSNPDQVAARFVSWATA